MQIPISQGGSVGENDTCSQGIHGGMETGRVKFVEFA
jgi:hypothetical protein